MRLEAHMARINFSPDDEEDLVDQMHEAIQALDERKVRELLAAGVPADIWGLPKTATFRFKSLRVWMEKPPWLSPRL
jgi:hypothetical protein